MTSAIVSTCAMLSALVSTQSLEPQCAVLYVQVIAIFDNIFLYYKGCVHSMRLTNTYIVQSNTL